MSLRWTGRFVPVQENLRAVRLAVGYHVSWFMKLLDHGCARRRLVPILLRFELLPVNSSLLTVEASTKRERIELEVASGMGPTERVDVGVNGERSTVLLIGDGIGTANEGVRRIVAKEKSGSRWMSMILTLVSGRVESMLDGCRRSV